MRTYSDFWRSLTAIYEESEARSIASLVMERCLGMTLTDICMGNDDIMAEADYDRLQGIKERLLSSEPVQYIIGEECFRGHVYHVSPGVLIPRPETAALVDWMVDDFSARKSTEGMRLLDCCCGSGCISIEMKYEFPDMIVEGLDIAEEAILATEINAMNIGVDVKVFKDDVLAPVQIEGTYDCIVSNPPYVCDFEKRQMRANVLDWEPAVALFVPDDNPLLFYEAITDMAVSALSDGGSLYFEINPLFVQEMEQMLVSKGMVDVVVNESQQYNNRMMRAMKPLD